MTQTSKIVETILTRERLLRESLEIGDLKRLVKSELHIDEYKSKMGEDKDVSVVSFKVSGKEPGNDIVSFIEKGYPFVLDADVSSGEKEDSDYLVFVELERDDELASHIVELIDDMLGLTDQTMEEWRFKCYKCKDPEHETELTLDNLKDTVIMSPELYEKKYGSSDQEEIDDAEEEIDDQQDAELAKELDEMKTAAGVKVTTTAPVNEFTDSVRVAAGLK